MHGSSSQRCHHVDKKESNKWVWNVYDNKRTLKQDRTIKEALDTNDKALVAETPLAIAAELAWTELSRGGQTDGCACAALSA